LREEFDNNVTQFLLYQLEFELEAIQKRRPHLGRVGLSIAVILRTRGDGLQMRTSTLFVAKNSDF